MADNVKELVASWTVDGTSWKTAIASLRSILKQADAEEKARAAATKAAQASSLAALNQELQVRKSIAAQVAAMSKGGGSSNNKDQSQALASAQALLATTKQQIAAEQLKGQAIKTALQEQKAAAAQAIAFEKAYAAQVAEVAKNKAKAVALYDAAYQAQSNEVQKNKSKQLPSQPSTQDYSKIPIVVNKDKNVPLQETTVAAYGETQAAATETAEVVEVAAAKEVAANTAVVDSLKTKAIVSSSATKDAVVNATEEEVAVSASAKAYLNLLAAEVKLAEAKTAVIEVQNAVAKGTMSEATATRYLTADLAALKTAQLEAAAAKEVYNVAQNGQGGGHGVSGQQATSGAIRTVESLGKGGGMGSIRPVENFLAKTLGLGSVLQNLFPLIGGVAFVSMLGEGVAALVKMTKAAHDFSDNMKDTFTAVSLGADESNDKLKLTNDQLENTLAKLEHKPVNNIAIAFDEARIKADELGASAIKAYDEVKKLLDANQLSLFDQLTTNKGSTKDISAKLEETSRDIKNAKLALSTAQRALVENPNNDKTVAAKNAGTQTQIDAAQKQVDAATAAQNTYINNTRKTINGQVQGRVGGMAPAFLGPLGSIVNALGSKQTMMKYSSVHGDQTANNQMLDTVQNLNMSDTDRDALEKKNASDENKVKVAEEQKRQNEITIKDAQAALEDKKKLAAEALEDAKSNIEDEAAANEKMYKDGSESAAAYYAQKKALAQQTYEATVTEINAETDAQQKQLSLQKQLGELTPTRYKALSEGAEHDRQRKITQAGATQNKSNNQTDAESAADSLEAQIKSIDNVTDAKKKALQIQTDSVKSAYNEQTISAEDYIAQSIDLINKEVAAVEAAEEQKRTLGKQTLAAKQESIKREQQAIEEGQQKLSEINNTSMATRVSGSSARYGNQSGLLESQMGLAQTPGSGVNTVGNQSAILSQQKQAAVDYQLQQTKLLSDPSLQTYSQQWFTIYENIIKAKQAVIDISNQQQALSTKSGSEVGGMFQAGASAAGTVFNSRYGQGVTRSISAGGASAAAAGGYMSTLTQSSPIDSLSSGIDVFTKKITAGVQAVGSFITSINNAGSASAGAFGGAISGGGIGQAAGTSLGANNGPLSGMGSMAGPFGALIGASLGAALGAITGQKQEEVQDDVNMLNQSFKQTMDEYSTNNASLAQTVINLQNLIAQAQADESSTKKGGDQFKNLILQYNQQITQLEQQQAQVMSQLNNQLVQISSPEAYQPLISSIQDILQQYTQYVGAAQNATDLANANNYLTQSLQNLAQSYSETLNQDQETAIQDALQLNDLYNQRNQLEQQYLSQVESIQGQGTLTRGITQSQSKFSQLYNLDVNQASQLDQINQQISMEQYKVTAESQIFQLATTRVGLESQLLAAQEQGINLDMSRITAMQNVLATIQSSGYSLTNLGSLNTSDPNALLTLLLQLLASQLGVNTGGANNPGNSLLDSATSAAYSQRASYGYANFRGANL